MNSPEEKGCLYRQFCRERDQKAFVEKRVDETFDKENFIDQERASRDRALGNLLARPVCVRTKSSVGPLTTGVPAFAGATMNWRTVRWRSSWRHETISTSRLKTYLCGAEAYRRIAESTSEDTSVIPTGHTPLEHPPWASSLTTVTSSSRSRSFTSRIRSNICIHSSDTIANISELVSSWLATDI